MAFVCSPYSASDSISNCPSMLVNEMIGKTTLMVLAVTPRALVLAWVTGVGALEAPDGAATPEATTPPRTAMAPPALSSRNLAPDLPQRRIAHPRVRPFVQGARKRLRHPRPQVSSHRERCFQANRASRRRRMAQRVSL